MALRRGKNLNEEKNHNQVDDEKAARFENPDTNAIVGDQTPHSPYPTSTADATAHLLKEEIKQDQFNDSDRQM